jgi:hypothetical protein
MSVRAAGSNLSPHKFPANREKNREFRQIRPCEVILNADTRANSEPCSEIPYSTEQGIICDRTGILTAHQGGEQGLGCWIDSLAGVLNLKLHRAPISERGVEPAFVVDLVDEMRKRVDDVGERLVAAEVRLPRS